MADLYEFLVDARRCGRTPRVVAYNRIDGPGSSLDLREFQQSFWRLPAGREWLDGSPEARWSRLLPRTIGITINTGVTVEAHPLPDGQIGVESIDYGTRHVLDPDSIAYRPELWLAKVADAMGITGVLFKLHNLVAGTKSAGLGGSATATTGVCLLANRLAGKPLSAEQIVAMASHLEQDMGVSITGTQEQANVVYGGVTDYVWFPWGVPGTHTGFGASIRSELLPRSRYGELEMRLAIYHSGRERASTDVNAVWRQRLSENASFAAFRRMLPLAYEFREGIRNLDWEQVVSATREYRALRVSLCADYMSPQCWEIQGQCERLGAEGFPLGAGGGGAVLVLSPDPEALHRLRKILAPVYRYIKYRILSRGHEFSTAGRIGPRPDRNVVEEEP